MDLRVFIESPSVAETEHPLLKYCGTVSDEDTKEIEKIIDEQFERVNPDDWK